MFTIYIVSVSSMRSELHRVLLSNTIMSDNRNVVVVIIQVLVGSTYLIRTEPKLQWLNWS